MSIEADITSGLIGHAGLNNLIGERVHQDELPQGSIYPAIRFMRISTATEQAIDRSIASHLPRWRFSIWGSGGVETRKVKDQLILALVALTGDTVTINGLEILDQRAYGFDEDNKKHREDLDARILHQ